MGFALDEDLGLLRDTAEGFFAEKAPLSAWRALRDAGGGMDESLASETAALGFAGTLVGEDYGGSGLGFRAMGLILEAQGRTLAATPLLQTGLIGAGALALFGTDEQKALWGPGLADGSIRIALACDTGPRHAGAVTVGTVSADGRTVTGAARFVPDAGGATHLLAPARRDGEVVLALAPRAAPGVTLAPLVMADHRDWADVTLAGADIADGGVLACGPDGLERLLDVARAGVAAEMLGLMSAAFAMTHDYLQTRTQFGQLIGSFQGLQHRAAQMLVEMELTRSCVLHALIRLDEGADAREAVSLAKARAGDTLHLVTNETIQMHGGIGMTDAHDSGFFLKRARLLETLYGSAAWHRDRYARLAGY